MIPTLNYHISAPAHSGLRQGATDTLEAVKDIGTP